MKTAEVAIEHVLAGILTLCAFVLPLLSGLKIDRSFLQAEIIVGFLGMAYLFGVVFDRVADSVLGPIEQWLRLRLIHKKLKDKKLFLDDDPFPQDALEFSLRGEKNGRIEWMDSLRSRIRTSRELTVLGLPAAMGVGIYVTQVGLSWWPHSAVALNLFFISMSLLISSRLISSSRKFMKFKIRKTYELNIKDDMKREDQMDEAKCHMLICSSPYVLVLINSAVTISTITAARPRHSEILAIGVFGTVATLFALWAWYRITNTYMEFVYQRLGELLSQKQRLKGS